MTPQSIMQLERECMAILGVWGMYCARKDVSALEWPDFLTQVIEMQDELKNCTKKFEGIGNDESEQR